MWEKKIWKEWRKIRIRNLVIWDREDSGEEVVEEIEVGGEVVEEVEVEVEVEAVEGDVVEVEAVEEEVREEIQDLEEDTNVIIIRESIERDNLSLYLICSVLLLLNFLNFYYKC